MTSLILHCQIGSGGFGCVYRAERAGEICAAKKCYASHAELPQAAIKREVAILSQLRHHHIIQYFDTVEHEGHTYILMNLAEKGSLAGAIVRGEVSDWATKKRIAHEIARGLEYIHHHDILHRDLKTENVLLTRYMEVKLCDFGLAKVKPFSESAPTDSFKGTVRWAAPETLELKPKFSKKSDIYSFGMVMWAMAANRSKPFEDQHVNEVIIAHVQRGQREVMPAATPPEYRIWIERCWRQDPERRPSANEVVLMENNSPIMRPDNGLDISLSCSSNSQLEAIRGKCIKNQSADMLGELTFIDRLEENSKQSPQRDDVLVYLRRKASEGNADAQLFLGWVYEQGLGPAGTVEDAPGWYRKAAEQGHVSAQLQLGLSYERNNSAGHNHGDGGAVKWYRMAAENGDAQAQLRLGLLYAYGRGVQQNDVEAARWFHRSASQGVAEAQFNIALMYSRGQDIDQSDGEAAKWMRKAAEQDMLEAQFGLGLMYYDGRGLDQSFEMTAFWYHHAAVGGHLAAHVHLGVMYVQGEGVEMSELEAVKWFRIAAEQGHSDAQVKLGLIYEEGNGVQENIHEAVTWYFKAAAQKNVMAEFFLLARFKHYFKDERNKAVNACLEAACQGNIIAQRYLSDLYKDGAGVVQNDIEAVAWYRKAADQGDKDAQRCLGSMYLDGRGVEQNDIEAVAWYRKAADQGDKDAQRCLGSMYLDGRGVEQNDAVAASWYRKAADQGDVSAQQCLEFMYLNGRGVEQNDIETLSWFRKARDSWCEQAEIAIGHTFKYDFGVGQSDGKDLYRYRKVANQDNPDVQQYLSDMDVDCDELDRPVSMQ